jgi:hypothetical protein
MNIRILNATLVVMFAICGQSAQGAGPQFLGLLQDFYAAPQDSASRHSAIATMDLDEAVGDLVPLAGERWSDVVKLPSGDFYAINDENLGSVYYFNHETMLPLKLTVAGPGVPLNPILVGLTYDDTRDRLVVSTVGGADDFLEYREGTGLWKVVGGSQHPGLRALTYRQRNDTLYGLGSGLGTNSLYRFDGNGEPLGTIPLSAPIGINTTHGLDWQMMLASDGRLAVIIAEWDNDSLGNHTGIESRVYLIDPDTGVVNGQGVPEPTAMGTLLAAAGLLLRRARVG